jgi:hypothetical protein
MATYILMACFAGVFVLLFCGLFIAITTVERTRDRAEREPRESPPDHRRQPPMGHHLPTA